MNKLDKDYQDILKDILKNGNKKSDRTGTGTISVFGRCIRHKMTDGFPLLTSKKMAWKSIAIELIWFLRGDTNIKYLVENNCNIWNGDSYKSYCKLAGSFEEPDYSVHIDDPNNNCVRVLSNEEFIEKIKTDDEFANKWGELGPIYGKQWRNWDQIDQISNLIRDLKENPDSRRLMVNAWNVSEIDQMTLPPCHYGFQCYTRELSFEERIIQKNKRFPIDTCDLDTEEKLDNYNIPKRALSLQWSQRSCDFPLGIPYNIASYGLLLEILAKIVNMVPDELIGAFGDSHIYINQIDGVKEQIERESFNLPKLKINIDTTNFDPENLECNNFEILDYISQPKIYFPLSN